MVSDPQKTICFLTPIGGRIVRHPEHIKQHASPESGQRGTEAEVSTAPCQRYGMKGKGNWMKKKRERCQRYGMNEKKGTFSKIWYERKKGYFSKDMVWRKKGSLPKDMVWRKKNHDSRVIRFLWRRRDGFNFRVATYEHGMYMWPFTHSQNASI